MTLISSNWRLDKNSFYLCPGGPATRHNRSLHLFFLLLQIDQTLPVKASCEWGIDMKQKDPETRFYFGCRNRSWCHIFFSKILFLQLVTTQASRSLVPAMHCWEISMLHILQHLLCTLLNVSPLAARQTQKCKHLNLMRKCNGGELFLSFGTLHILPSYF